MASFTYTKGEYTFTEPGIRSWSMQIEEWGVANKVSVTWEYSGPKQAPGGGTIWTATPKSKYPVSDTALSYMLTFIRSRRSN